jgi:hypothetical protein
VGNTVGDGVDTICLASTDKLGNRVSELLALLERVVHALPDVLVKLLVAELAQLGGTVDTVLLSGTDDATSDNDGDLTDAADVGVQPAISDLLLVEGGGQGRGGGVDHVLCDGRGLGENGAESDTGENVHVVSLAGCEKAAVVLHRREWRSGSKETAALGVEDSLLECALGLAGGVGQGEDDRPFSLAIFCRISLVKAPPIVDRPMRIVG